MTSDKLQTTRQGCSRAANDRGKRCIVLHGWAKGARGVIVGPASVGGYFTVQLDDGPRFCALPGEVAPITDQRREQSST